MTFPNTRPWVLATVRTRKARVGDAWVVQSVEHLTLDFGSGHDMRVVGLNPVLGSMLSVEPA